MNSLKQVLVEVHGFDGVPKPWRGEVFYDPRRHKRHLCEARWLELKARLAKNKEELARRKRFEEGLE